MNRLTLMQTQSPVPIQYFNSQTTLVAQNSSNYADHEATSHPTASLALPALVAGNASGSTSNTASTDKVSLKSSPEPVLSIHARSEVHVAYASVASAIPASLPNDRKCLMLVTIKADCVADLRHLVMRTCGELIVFIRTQPIAHSTKMKVWLYLSSTATDVVMDAIMRSLPSVEFGQITHR